MMDDIPHCSRVTFVQIHYNLMCMMNAGKGASFSSTTSWPYKTVCYDVFFITCVLRPYCLMFLQTPPGYWESLQKQTTTEPHVKAYKKLYAQLKLKVPQSLECENLNFSDSQSKVLDFIRDFLQKPQETRGYCRIILTGGAGGGKSAVLRAIHKLVNTTEGMILAAPTGKTK